MEHIPVRERDNGQYGIGQSRSHGSIDALVTHYLHNPLRTALGNVAILIPCDIIA